MAQIKTSLPHRYGKTIKMLTEKVTFDSNGIAEVEDSFVDEIRPHLSDFNISIEGEDASTTAEKLAQKPDEDTTKKEENMNLKAMTVAQLQELAAGVDLPVEEWKDLKKKNELIKYIESKLQN